MAKRGPRRQMLDLRLNRTEGFAISRALIKAQGCLLGEEGMTKQEAALAAMEAAEYEIIAKRVMKALLAMDVDSAARPAMEEAVHAINH